MTQSDALAPKKHSQAIGIPSARKGFAVNVAANLAFAIISVVINTWYTPFLIGRLGLGTFGIISLANSLVVYMRIVTDGLNSAVTRFLTIDLHRADSQAANKTFNTAFFGLLGVMAVLIPITLLFSLAFPYLFDVPAGTEGDAGWFFRAVVLSFGIGTVTSTFAVSTFAHSRFVSRNVINFVAMATRIGLVVLLFSLLPARLWHVGLALVVASLVSSVGFYLMWRRLTPELTIQPKAVDRAQMRPLMGMGGWVIVHRVGAMLLKNLDLIVVNAAFGAAATGGYAAALQMTRQPQSLVSTVTDVMNPMILRKYAQGDVPGLTRIILQATKLIGLCLALPVGVICGLSQPLLSVWLGPSFVEWTPVLIVLTADMSLNLSMRPSGLVQTAYNRIRWPGIAMVISGVVNLVLAFSVAFWGGLGPLGVALVGTLVMTAKNVLFFPIYTAHIMELHWYTLFPPLITTALVTLATALAAYGLTWVQMPTGWLSLGLHASIVSLAYAAVVGLLLLNGDDRQLLKSIILRRG